MTNKLKQKIKSITSTTSGTITIENNPLKRTFTFFNNKKEILHITFKELKLLTPEIINTFTIINKNPTHILNLLKEWSNSIRINNPLNDSTIYIFNTPNKGLKLRTPHSCINLSKNDIKNIISFYSETNDKI